MQPITGVYEVAVRVGDLAAAEKFYADILGLKVGLRDTKRNWIFLSAEGDAGMVVLIEDKGEWPKQHFALTVDSKDDLTSATLELRGGGVEVRGPVHHDWMGAESIYFTDPDGHDLELIHVPKANPHRRAAVSTFNAVWELLGKPERTHEETEQMISLAHASRYHWSQVGDEQNFAVGEWMLSRIYAVLGQEVPAVHHGRRGLEICDRVDIGVFYRAYAHEALARAHALRDPDKARRHLLEARKLAETIPEAENRKAILDDLATVEVGEES